MYGAGEQVVFGPEQPAEDTYGEWNPSADTVRPVRGKHRVSRQRGGTIARSRAVLGVGVIAAVGAGGMTSANEDATAVPGVGAAADKVKSIPDHVPGLNTLLGNSSGDHVITAAPLTAAGLTVSDSPGVTQASHATTGDAGEALRSRLLQQAERQENRQEAEERAEALDAAEQAAAEQAAATAAAEKAEAERIEEERKRKAEEERLRKEEEERIRKLRASFISPLSDYRITANFGDSGTMWSNNHTGTDLSAPSGTPVKAVHTGVVKEAAWAGSYGYRVIVELEDGTEVSYSHLSTMLKSAGDEVVTGDVIARVGSTGNSSGPHLHLEVRPGGGAAVDPLAWLRGKGVSI
ncbi:M23 family metallopeptidase [Streptomyces sp. ACA25]|uniref:M23 family metallopeptidase n=1 Tax=Streptomyces sp. ACA25 TaxID=3022596 RepID=UPI003FA7ECE0